MFGKSREFRNKFSEEINALNEDENDGIYITNKRFQYFIDSLTNQIETNNNEILKEIEEEDSDVRISMLSQFDVDSNLNYFSDTILKSILVAIYSNFENRLDKISEICEENLVLKKGIKDFKKGSIINKRNDFLKSEVIPEVSSLKSDFDKILVWNQIRNDIVHNNSMVDRFNPDKFDHPSLIVKYDRIILKDRIVILEFLNLTSKYLMNIIDEINKRYDLIE
jgi:hypothetical protein